MILVTGYRGYIGSRLYQELKKLGHDVYGLDLKEGEDIIECLPNLPCEYVFHMAALPRVEYSVASPSYTLKHNVYATSILLEWAVEHGVKRVIFSSSAAAGASPGPKSPYGLHKLMSELECQLYSELYNLDVVCLRYFNVFSEDQNYGGSYSTVICAWKEMLKTDQQLRIDGEGTQSRDFIHVNDIVDANIFCMNCSEKFSRQYYDVGTGEAISLNEIKEIVEFYHEATFLRSPPRPGDITAAKADISQLKNMGWSAKIEPLQAIKNCFKGE
jgi:UDP-glucose 4-epimerase